MSAAATVQAPAGSTGQAPAMAGALLDWDGTLIDSRAALLAAWHEATYAVLGRRYPASPTEEDVVFTLPGAQIWAGLAQDEGQRAALAARFQAAYERNGSRVRAFPGVPEMLRGLRGAGVGVAVITSKARRRYTSDAVHAGLEGLIDAAICAEDAGAAKPDPEPVRRGLHTLGVAPARAVMAGDTPVDIAAAIAAGTAAIGVTWGHGAESDLRAAGATALAHEPAELLALVLGGVSRAPRSAGR